MVVRGLVVRRHTVITLFVRRLLIVSGFQRTGCQEMFVREKGVVEILVAWL